MKAAATKSKEDRTKKVAQSDLPDVIKQLGYRAEKLKSGWVAYEVLGDRRFGPCRTQALLHDAIVAGNITVAGAADAVTEDTDFEVLSHDAAAAESEIDEEFTDLEEDVNKQKFLKGMAPKIPPVIQPIIDQVFEIERILKPDFASARDALIAGQENLSKLAHGNIKYFSEPDDKGKRVYRAGGVKVTITFEKEKISTEIDEDDTEKK
jgi:hypothetical protein